jgi:transcriptional regulator with GAF, ATPase, and Fis domain
MTSAAHPAAPPSPPDRSESSRHASAPETPRLSSLLEISQALSGTLNLKSAMHNVLETLTRHHGAIRGIVMLLRENGELSVEACDGLNQPGASVKHRIGEGVMGRVVESGRPVVVPAREQRACAAASRVETSGAARKGPELYLCADCLESQSDRRSRGRSEIRART